MSLRSHELAVQQYAAQFQSAYETGSQLIDCVKVRRGVQAEAVHFPVFGTAKSTTRDTSDDVARANIGNARPMVVLEPCESFDYVDKQDRHITNVDLLMGYAIPLGNALSRQYDERILRALRTWNTSAYTRPGLSAASTSHLIETAASNIVGPRDVAKAVAVLRNESVTRISNYDMTLVVPALQFEQMSQQDKWSSNDFIQGNRTTRDAMMNRIYGCRVIFFESGSIVDDAGNVDTDDGGMADNEWYVFAKEAVGLAVGAVETLGVVEWIPQKRSHLVGGESSAGATRIQNAGIIKGTIKA